MHAPCANTPVTVAKNAMSMLLRGAKHYTWASSLLDVPFTYRQEPGWRPQSRITLTYTRQLYKTGLPAYCARQQGYMLRSQQQTGTVSRCWCLHPHGQHVHSRRTHALQRMQLWYSTNEACSDHTAPEYGDQNCVSGGTSGSTCHMPSLALTIQSMKRWASLPISPVP